MKRITVMAAMAAALSCSKNQSAADTTAAMATPVAATTQAAAPTPMASGETTSSALADPNAASREQLAGAGVDSATIGVIIAKRPYADMVSFDKAVAAKMNSNQRKTLYSKVFKPIDLNTAKRDEILLIPGVGPKMLHEFEEYRPYKNIEQFRREIGKYVKPAEVARLEQYVVVK